MKKLYWFLFISVLCFAISNPCVDAMKRGRTGDVEEELRPTKKRKPNTTNYDSDFDELFDLEGLNHFEQELRDRTQFRDHFNFKTTATNLTHDIRKAASSNARAAKEEVEGWEQKIHTMLKHAEECDVAQTYKVSLGMVLEKLNAIKKQLHLYSNSQHDDSSQTAEELEQKIDKLISDLERAATIGRTWLFKRKIDLKKPTKEVFADFIKKMGYSPYDLKIESKNRWLRILLGVAVGVVVVAGVTAGIYYYGPTMLEKLKGSSVPEPTCTTTCPNSVGTVFSQQCPNPSFSPGQCLPCEGTILDFTNKPQVPVIDNNLAPKTCFENPENCRVATRPVAPLKICLPGDRVIPSSAAIPLPSPPSIVDVQTPLVENTLDFNHGGGTNIHTNVPSNNGGLTGTGDYMLLNGNNGSQRALPNRSQTGGSQRGILRRATDCIDSSTLTSFFSGGYRKTVNCLNDLLK